MNSSRSVIFAAIAILLVIAIWWQPWNTSSVVVFDPSRGDSPEDCPHIPVGTTGDTVVIAGKASQVPEYHDCQRLILADDRTYGPKVGIYVRPDANQAQPDPSWRPWALIRNYHETAYGPLGIGPGYSCLLLKEDSAKVVPVGMEETCSLGDKDWTQMDGVILDLRKHATDDPVPAAGRWGWDSRNRWQYIVVGCGKSQWCEIGPTKFAPDPLPDFSELPPGQAKRLKVQPWADVQRLAIGGAGGLEPGPTVGIGIPVDTLGEINTADFTRQWLPVASLYISGETAKYTEGLNLKPARFNHLPELQFCAGKTARECRIPSKYESALACTVDESTGQMWFARIRRPRKVLFTYIGTHDQYHCLTRRAHVSSIPVPGTVRWRFIEADETKWARCGSACCQVN